MSKKSSVIVRREVENQRDMGNRVPKREGYGLCAGCKIGLGMLGDSIEGLEGAIAYLRKAT